jgi:ferric-dicitrate binding protein FerR (iron transport regulator)
MTLDEALEFASKLAEGNYTRRQLDELMNYLHTAERPELEAFFGVYGEAIHELPEPGPVNPDFRKRLYSLYPGKDAESAGDTSDNASCGDPSVDGAPSPDRPLAHARRHTLARTRYMTLAVGLAAMITLVAVSIRIWKPGTPIRKSLAQKTLPEQPVQIIPGGNKAVLTLAGGRQIILDSLQNGSVALQGNTHILKLASGRLAYQPDHTGSGAIEYNTITTPKGGQYQVSLPDGSRVWLNAASSLRFPTSFDGNERQVEMTGEVYFEVAQNRDKPFFVRSGGFNVEVLGTHFDVNAYADEAVFKTTLLEGSVNVGNTSGHSLLEPGEQAVAGISGGNIRILREADTEAAVAWKNGRFEFSNADIPTIMRQIARWYDVDIRYEGNIPPEHFSGEVPRSCSLDKVLKIFALSQIHFRIEGKEIIVVA